MKSNTRKPLGLEELEDRWVPATVRFDGSNLFVSSPLVTAGKSQISVIEQAGATPAFQVMDGTANNGSFTVTGNITVNGNNASDQIAVEMTNTGLAGNVSVTTGNGTSSVTVDGTTGSGAAFIAGSVNVSMGTGSNSVWVGSKQPAGGVFSGTSNGLFIRGNVTLNSRSNSTSTAFVNNSGTPPPWIFSGNVSVSGFPTVNLGAKTQANVLAGNVTVNNTSNGQPGTITLASAILGNFSVNGSVGGSTTVNINNNVLGQTSLNLGNGTNSVALGGGTAGKQAVTLNNFSYNAGNGSNTFTANNGNTATILGNANLNWGNGANGFGSSTGLTVNGNVFLNDGNGGLNVATSTFQGNVFGRFTVNAGNGNNLFTFDGTNGAAVGGPFTYTAGNGGNSVTVTNAPAAGSASLINLNVRFGTNNANLFTLGALGAPAAGTISGSVTWAIPTAFIAGVNASVDNG